MCEFCGCSETREMLLTNLQTGAHVHLDAEGQVTAPAHHVHSHGEYPHSHPEARGKSLLTPSTVKVEVDILGRNNLAAERNRKWFEGQNILVLNLMSSPGAGKTTLLERLLTDCSTGPIQVIEGDQATLRDAQRIRATRSSVVQVNTGSSCHLTAQSIEAATRQLTPSPNSTVIIENVGNLVCPALFDLGEEARVVVASVTEGDDKPLKYPHMFRLADLILLNKIDLLPHVDFDPLLFEKYARERNPKVEILRVSAKTRDGLDAFYAWIRGLKLKLS